MFEAKLTLECTIQDVKMEIQQSSSLVDDNISMGPDHVINEERTKIGNLIDNEDVGPLNEYSKL